MSPEDSILNHLTIIVMVVSGNNKILLLPSNFFSSNSNKKYTFFKYTRHPLGRTITRQSLYFIILHKIVGETNRTQYNYVDINVDEIVKYLFKRRTRIDS